MADIKYMPPDHARLDRAGDRARASVLVEASAWPAIRARRELTRRLLSGTCPIGGPQTWQLGPEDLPLLLMMTEERFGGAHALLRKQAVAALGLIDDEAARQRLTGLALDPLEHDGTRIAAIGALGARGGDLAGQLADDPSPLIQSYARRLRGEQPPTPGKEPRQIAVDGTGRRAGDRGPARGAVGPVAPGDGPRNRPAGAHSGGAFPSRREMWIAVFIAVISVIVAVAILLRAAGP